VNRQALVFAAAVILASGCAHVDSSKAEEMYYSKSLEAHILTGPAASTQTAQVTAPLAVTQSAASATTTAAKTAAAAPKKKKFRVKEFVVNSDSMTYNKDTAEAVFIGNIVAEADNVRIYADQLKSKNYKEKASASGNVRAYYMDFGIIINSDTFDYSSSLSKILAQGNVVARKFLDNGNTITMRADIMEFDADEDILTARKGDTRVRVTMQDIMAFADLVVYNNISRQMEMTGKPFLKKGKSLFFSDDIQLDVDKKTIKLNKSIWTKLFYGDFEKAAKENNNGTNYNKAPR